MSFPKLGPGQPCMSCGQTYGQHLPGCLTHESNQRSLEKVYKTLGDALLQAIEAKDSVKIGRLLVTLIKD